jgi:RNA polymerase sigma-70 factor (ECF subfamily)
VRAWLFTVARNLVIDDRRSARYTRELQSDYLPDRPSPDAIGPAFDKWILSDALTSLSPDHRSAIVRAYYLGQTVADIAQQEGIPEGTVKSRLHYALRALRIALQERGVVR